MGRGEGTRSSRRMSCCFSACSPDRYLRSGPCFCHVAYRTAQTDHNSCSRQEFREFVAHIADSIGNKVLSLCSVVLLFVPTTAILQFYFFLSLEMSVLFADIMGLSAAPVGVELQTNVAEFFQAFDSPICEVLLDQRYFNGIGNYLRAEILGRAGINVHFVYSYLSLSLSVCPFCATLRSVHRFVPFCGHCPQL